MKGVKKNVVDVVDKSIGIGDYEDCLFSKKNRCEIWMWFAVESMNCLQKKLTKLVQGHATIGELYLKMQ